MSGPTAFIQDMNTHGVVVQSPWDLVNRREPYPDAVPALIEWLIRSEAEVPAAEQSKFREGLVRSLAVREARGIAVPALIREFHRVGESSEYRWAVGNALEVVADDSAFDQLVGIAQDRSYGRDRQMVVLALARTRDVRAVEVLTDLLDDQTVVGHALMALGRLKASSSRPAIEKCLDRPEPWVRKEASKALAKLDN